jgi:hypothetical protein
MAKEQRSHLASPLVDDQLIPIWIKIIDAIREQFVFLIPYCQSECNCWHERKNLILLGIFILLLFFQLQNHKYPLQDLNCLFFGLS